MPTYGSPYQKKLFIKRQKMNPVLRIFPIIFSCISLFANSAEYLKNRSFYYPYDLSELPIADWKNPTMDDYALINQTIRANIHRMCQTSEEEREPFTAAKELGWVTYRMRKIQFINIAHPENPPECHTIYFNNDPNRKDKCIVCYLSFSPLDINWPRGIKLMIQALKVANYDGHFMYRIGGWPSLQKNRLKLADVPYAFKPFFLEEARDLGYEKILWIDACIMPLTNLDLIFQWLEQQGFGYFSYGCQMPAVYMNPRKYVMSAMGFHPTRPYRDISSRVVGINTKHARGNTMLDAWLAAAELKIPFCEPNGDQLSFATIVNEMHFLNCEFPATWFQETSGKKISKPRNPRTQLSHQIGIVDATLGEPDLNDIFER